MVQVLEVEVIFKLLPKNKNGLNAKLFKDARGTTAIFFLFPYADNHGGNTISIFKSLAIPYWSKIGGNWIKSRSIMDY